MPGKPSAFLTEVVSARYGLYYLVPTASGVIMQEFDDTRLFSLHTGCLHDS